MEKQLRLSRDAIEPSRAGLYRFGNVSSTSVWYVLAFVESHRGVRRGDKVRGRARGWEARRGCGARPRSWRAA
jgi:3-ketoacyl-CoA synthase